MAKKPAGARGNANIEAQQELQRRRLIPFTMHYQPHYEAGWFHLDLAMRLEKFVADVAAKKSPRLIIQVPPRHGKSELASKNWPAWVLGHHPDWEFITASYGSTLPFKFSRYIRGLLRDSWYGQLFPNTVLDPESQSVEMWRTTEEGGLLASGIGGGITGFGAHILLIDDPVKNWAEAQSETVRDQAWDWYASTAYSRLAPGGGVIIIQTRWHHDDLAGRALEQARLDPDAEGFENWELVSYPAIAMHDEAYRRAGEALHPERYNLTALRRIRGTVGPQKWAALYQQTPTAEEGDVFTKQNFRYYTPAELPSRDDLNFYATWDLAIGQNERNDYTVGVVFGYDREENLYVVDFFRDRIGAAQIVDRITAMNVAWRISVCGIEREKIEMAIGPFLERQRIKTRDPAVYYTIRPGRRDKVSRAQTIAGKFQLGQIYFPRSADWTPLIEDELLKFPNGRNDDIVDCFSGLGLMDAELSKPYRKQEARKSSWRDKLRQYVKSGPSASSHMSA